MNPNYRQGLNPRGDYAAAQQVGTLEEECPDCGECPSELRKGVCALVGLVVLGFIGLQCLGAVEPLNYALKYNHFSKTVDTAVIYTPGRYFIGPFSKFLFFPSSVQTIEFSNIPHMAPVSPKVSQNPPLVTRTEDALSVDIHVSLQYRLPKDNVAAIYNQFNLNYEQVFVTAVRDKLLTTVSRYEVTDLWKQRDQFQKDMFDVVNAKLKASHAECWGLQMLILDLPDNFEERLVRTQVQNQEILKTQYAQTVENISATTKQIESTYDRQVKVLKANGLANYTVTTQEAAADANRKRLESETNALKTIKSTLGLNASELVTYQRLFAMGNMEDAKLLFGFSTPQVLLGQGGGAPR